MERRRRTSKRSSGKGVREQNEQWDPSGNLNSPERGTKIDCQLN